MYRYCRVFKARAGPGPLLLYQMLFQMASHLAQPGPRRTGVRGHTSVPLPSPTMDHPMGVQARGMIVGRALRAVPLSLIHISEPTRH